MDPERTVRCQISQLIELLKKYQSEFEKVDLTEEKQLDHVDYIFAIKDALKADMKEIGFL